MLFLLAGAAGAQIAPQVRLVEQHSGVDVRLRGVSAVDERVAWASGREGTVLRTVDGGGHWQVMKVPGATELDFRDIEGFDAQRAIVLSIGPGEASRVYRTTDGGRTWVLAMQNRDPDGFLDCMAFEGEHGVILGDPVDGRFQLHETRDGGAHWRLRDDGPQAAEGEAAFAASGTCIALADGAIAVATGGSQARVHYRSGGTGEESQRWQVTATADTAPRPSVGYFSIAATPAGFITVGGDYEQPEVDGLLATMVPGREPGAAAAILESGSRPGPAGYRSGIACHVGLRACVATGPSGTDWWDGKQWTAVSALGFDAIDLAGSTGWLSGDAGRIARVEIGPAD